MFYSFVFILDGKHYQPQIRSAPQKSYTTAAFVIVLSATVVAVAIISFIVMRRRSNWKKTQEHHRVVTSFENPIYSSDGSTKPLTEALPHSKLQK